MKRDYQAVEPILASTWGIVPPAKAEPVAPPKRSRPRGSAADGAERPALGKGTTA